MKKTLIASILFCAALFTSNVVSARDIIIDVNGKGKTKISGDTYTFDCDPAPECCGTLTIKCPGLSVNPLPGDPVVIQEREEGMIVSEVTGTLANYFYDPNNPGFLSVELQSH